MKTLPEYAPSNPDHSGDNIACVKAYGRPPNGYRWVKIGETIPQGSLHGAYWLNKWEPVTGAVGTTLQKYHLIIIAPIEKKGHKTKIALKPTRKPDLDAKIATLKKEIDALDKKVYDMTAETNKVVAESRQKSADLKVLLAAAKILNKES